MRRKLLTLILAFLGILAFSITPAMATTGHAPAGASFHDKAFTFTYPNGWHFLPRKSAKAVAAGFGTNRNLHVTDVGGVKNGPAHMFNAAVIVIRLTFSKKFHRELKGRRTFFINKMMSSIKPSGSHVLARGTAVLGGQPASTIEFIQPGSSGNLRQKIFVVVPRNLKQMFAAIFVVHPASQWGSFISTFSSVTSSMALR